VKFTIRLPKLDNVRSAVLTIGGLGGLSASAWMLATPAGVAAASVSLLLLEWLTRPPAERSSR